MSVERQPLPDEQHAAGLPVPAEPASTNLHLRDGMEETGRAAAAMRQVFDLDAAGERIVGGPEAVQKMVQILLDECPRLRAP